MNKLFKSIFINIIFLIFLTSKNTPVMGEPFFDSIESSVWYDHVAESTVENLVLYDENTGIMPLRWEGKKTYYVYSSDDGATALLKHILEKIFPKINGDLNFSFQEVSGEQRGDLIFWAYTKSEFDLVAELFEDLSRESTSKGKGSGDAVDFENIKCTSIVFPKKNGAKIFKSFVLINLETIESNREVERCARDFTFLAMSSFPLGDDYVDSLCGVIEGPDSGLWLTACLWATLWIAYSVDEAVQPETKEAYIDAAVANKDGYIAFLREMMGGG